MRGVNGTVSGLLLGAAALVVLARGPRVPSVPAPDCLPPDPLENRVRSNGIPTLFTGPRRRRGLRSRATSATPVAQLDATGAAIAQLGVADPYDALVLLGDHAYPRGDPKMLARTVFGPFGAVLDQGTELLAVLGNHDVLDGHTVRAARRARDDRALVGARVRRPAPHRARHERARRSCATRVPPADARRLGGPDGSSSRCTTHRSRPGTRVPTTRPAAPSFPRSRAHGVDLVLSAHDHDYQRSHPIDGVTYIVTGGAARARFTGARSFTAASYRVRHFVEVAVLADRLVVRAIDQQQRVFDELVLSPRDRTAMRGSVAPGS